MGVGVRVSVGLCLLIGVHPDCVCAYVCNYRCDECPSAWVFLHGVYGGASVSVFGAVGKEENNSE